MMRKMIVAIALAVIVSACGGSPVGPTPVATVPPTTTGPTTPTPGVIRPACVPTAPTVTEGDPAGFRADGGDGTYVWVATPDAIPAGGNTVDGDLFKTVFHSAGVRSVTVKSAGLEANCSVTVDPKPIVVPPTVTVDNVWRNMPDGAGNPGPIDYRWVSVSPAFGSTVAVGGLPLPTPQNPVTGGCDRNPEYCLFGQWEFRMKTTGLTHNQALLGQAVIGVMWGDGRSGLVISMSTIQAGGTTTIVKDRGTPAAFNGDIGRVTMAAWYGPRAQSRTQWTDAPCPSLDELGGWVANGPPCTFRSETYTTGWHTK